MLSGDAVYRIRAADLTQRQRGYRQQQAQIVRSIRLDRVRSNYYVRTAFERHVWREGHVRTGTRPARGFPHMDSIGAFAGVTRVGAGGRGVVGYGDDYDLTNRLDDLTERAA